ncbi:Gfo/Idh/MocA family protein [Companilactobacillus zhachilii]|uniref:Gfo/Idh/MocA family protein n=1 Tax=Companilactobacillus zhachilii TaxID=2304606 RepID=UPI0040343DAF
MKKIAIIGAGQIAEKVHVKYYASRASELELSAVFDVDIDRAKNFSERNNIKNAYSDIDKMLEEVKPDIVSICTPNAFHHELTIKALKAGADVICEKPPALQASDAKEMRDVAESNHKILAYDFQHRFSKETKYIKSMMPKMGKVDLIEAKALRRSGVPGWGNFISKDIQGGGPLIDIGIHMLDTSLYLLDYPEVQRVSATAFHGMGNSRNTGTFGEWDPNKYSVEDSLFGMLYLKNGSVIRISTSFLLNMQIEKEMNILIYGQNAGGSVYPAWVYQDNNGVLKTLGERSKKKTDEDSHMTSLSKFVDATFSRGDSEIANATQGYKLQLIIDALYQSAELNKDVNLY